MKVWKLHANGNLRGNARSVAVYSLQVFPKVRLGTSSEDESSERFVKYPTTGTFIADMYMGGES
jgi:hypothetical protein